MARLIDADKLIDFIDIGHLRHSGELCYSETEVANLLLHAPTVDAGPVVRCRDCKHWHKDTVFCGYMSYGEASERVNWYADDFCSYGERKEDDGNG